MSGCFFRLPTGRLARLAAAQGGRCHYCRRRMVRGGLHGLAPTIDHRVPRARGGANARANLVAACRACNEAKGPLTEDEFVAVRHCKRALREKVIAAHRELAPFVDPRLAAARAQGGMP